MTSTFTAIIENGVLRPVDPVELAEGTQVEVTIRPVAKPSARTATEALARIAALPSEAVGDPDTGRDHDKYLYGESPVQ